MGDLKHYPFADLVTQMYSSEFYSKGLRIGDQ